MGVGIADDNDLSRVEIIRLYRLERDGFAVCDGPRQRENRDIQAGN